MCGREGEGEGGKTYLHSCTCMYVCMGILTAFKLFHMLSLLHKKKTKVYFDIPFISLSLSLPVCLSLFSFSLPRLFNFFATFLVNFRTCIHLQYIKQHTQYINVHPHRFTKPMSIQCCSVFKLLWIIQYFWSIHHLYRERDWIQMNLITTSALFPFLPYWKSHM